MACVFAGIAIGPAIGSLLIQTTGNELAPFYGAFVAHSVQLLLTIITPESLSKARQIQAKRDYSEKKAKKAELAEEELWKARHEGHGLFRRGWTIFKSFFQPVAAIFRPLALLGPTRKPEGGHDWNLPILAMASALYTMMMVSLALCVPYALIT